ncbi:hypothetical protein LSAT2_008995 [Lamellibrachia satsuma]|nr:hypothetical protein LSAT2_008995 [Lamellibrachia satsuma]
MTLVSQFLRITEHVAFYLFAAISVLVLPVLTATYCNTAGRRGANLLRAGYVFCDPVLACLGVTPGLLLKELPHVVDEHDCLVKNSGLNATYRCMQNISGHTHMIIQWERFTANVTETVRSSLITDKKIDFLLIQAAIITPILLALLMGRRTRKMNFNTYVFTFVYWLLTAIEAIDLMENVLFGEDYRHVIYTTATMTSIIMILTNTYAVVTLCSYVAPIQKAAASKEHFDQKFDLLYKGFVGSSGLIFAEIPFLVARFQVWVSSRSRLLPGAFYAWFIKDVLFIGLIVVTVMIQTFGQKLMRIPFQPRHSRDGSDIVFEPEKRDAYIHRRRVQHSPCFTVTADVLRAADGTAVAATSETGTKKKLQKRVSFKLDGDRRTSPTEGVFKPEPQQQIACKPPVQNTEDSVADSTV